VQYKLWLLQLQPSLLDGNVCYSTCSQCTVHSARSEARSLVDQCRKKLNLPIWPRCEKLQLVHRE